MGLLDPVNRAASNATGTARDIVSDVLAPITGGGNNKFTYGDADYDYFLIQELEGPKKEIYLRGNQLPLDSLNFGGKQRISKDFYSGYTEPVTHVLGPQESDTVINGRLKDRKLPESYYGVSQELQKLMDSIRIRGNLCRFVLGEWERYGFIEECKFELFRETMIDYELTLNISGFNAPQNAKFLEQQREVPFDINESLIVEAELFIENGGTIPGGVPLSIAQQLNLLIGEVASAVNILTGYVDEIINAIDDIQKSINRAISLIDTTVRKVSNYVNYVKNFDFNEVQSADLTSRYNMASYSGAQISGGASLFALLNRFAERFRELLAERPQQRYMTVTGDTLQKIAFKIFNDSTQWKKIYDYNNLTSTELDTGVNLDIPRL